MVVQQDDRHVDGRVLEVCERRAVPLDGLEVVGDEGLERFGGEVVVGEVVEEQELVVVGPGLAQKFDNVLVAFPTGGEEGRPARFCAPVQVRPCL